MKKITLTQAMILGLLASQAYSHISFAQGTNVGGKPTIVTGDHESGTNTGGSEDGLPIGNTVDEWNTGIIQIIEDAKQSATESFNDNQIETAIRIYHNQLEVISNAASIPELHLSWTNKIASRTLELAGSLDPIAAAKEDRLAILNVYATTFDTIAGFYYKLDRDFMIPYRAKDKGFKMDLSAYEDELNKYIVKQGEWFEKRFVSVKNEYGTIPKYSTKIFLVALSSLSRGLADDLMSDSVTGPNLFPDGYKEIASRLKHISDKIDNHLAGGPVFSHNDTYAINDTYKQFTQVMNSLKK